MLCLQSSIYQSNNHIPHASLLIVKFYNYDNFRETCAEQIPNSQNWYPQNYFKICDNSLQQQLHYFLRKYKKPSTTETLTTATGTTQYCFVKSISFWA